MGSSQSTPSAPINSSTKSSSSSSSASNVPSNSTTDTIQVEAPNDDDSKIPPLTTKRKEQTNNNQKNNLTGFAFVQRKCRRKKRAYDKCYSDMYGGFIQSKSMENTACDDLFDDWRECILRNMKKDREARGLTTPVNKESMLAEVMEDDNNE